MRCYNLLLVSLIVFGSCGKKDTTDAGDPPPGTPTDTTSDLRILTYNIHHANPPAQPNTIDLASIANIIKQEQPHIVALQEVDVRTSRSGSTVHQAEELGRLTGLKAYFAKAIDYGGGEYGLAILSKFPMSEFNNHPLPTVAATGGESRILATAVIQLGNGKKLLFANTHLDAQSNDTNRYEQMNRIVDLLKGASLPVILAGDFNATAGTRIINILDAHFTRSCITSCGFTIPASSATKTIDFISFSPGKFTVLQHKVLQEKTASDHLPVFSVLRIK